MAKSIQMLAPDAVPSFDFLFFAALVATLLWFTFVGWRLTHRLVAEWRGPWLAACGMTTATLLTVGLFHDGININRSYEPVALQLKATLVDAGLEPADCVSAPGLPAGIRAMFIHYADLPLAPRRDAGLPLPPHPHEDGRAPVNAIGGPAGTSPHGRILLRALGAVRTLPYASRTAPICLNSTTTDEQKHHPAQHLHKALASLAGPIFVANIAIIGSGTIDTIMAGQLGKDHLAAITLGISATICVLMGLVGVLQGLSPSPGTTSARSAST